MERLKLAERVAAEAGGARAPSWPRPVGAVKGADDYIAAIEYNVTPAAALK